MSLHDWVNLATLVLVIGLLSWWAFIGQIEDRRKKSLPYIGEDKRKTKRRLDNWRDNL